ncbi:hypothetical protein AAMO2058_001112500 [Amorphochlora amoebiformis]
MWWKRKQHLATETALTQAPRFSLRLEQDQTIAYSDGALNVADDGAALLVLDFDTNLRDTSARTGAAEDLGDAGAGALLLLVNDLHLFNVKKRAWEESKAVGMGSWHGTFDIVLLRYLLTMPKGKKKDNSKKGGGGEGDMLKRENVLQAVLLADSFKVFFRPLTLDSPKVLLPLLNVPMINYTLEFLSASGVDELFVLCSAHATQVENHLKDMNLSMKVQVVRCENSFNESDFVLIGGDVVTNMSLKSVLAGHKARRKQDRLNIMTAVLKSAEPLHRTRGHADRSVIVIDSDTKQLLVYDCDPDDCKTKLEVSTIIEHPTLEFRMDLMDTSIYICGLDVLDLLIENFDWQDMQRHFLRGVLGDTVLGNKIHTHILSGDYAARIQDPKSYHSISQDIIRRWTYPMVPEFNLVGNTSFGVKRHNIYTERKVHIERSSKVICDSAIGEGTQIGPSCIVEGCVIGRNVIIQEGAQLRNCHVWDGCRIGKGAKIEESLLAQGVILGSDVTVSSNCILGCKLEVKSGVHVPAMSRLVTSLDQSLLDEIEEEEIVAESKKKGIACTGTQAYLYNGELEDIEDDDYKAYCLVPKERVEWPEEDDDDEDHIDNEGITFENPQGSDRIDSKNNTTGDYKGFEKEMVETLHRGIKEKLDVEAISLETSSLKLTHHTLLQDYYSAAFYAFFSLSSPPPVEGKKASKETLKSLLGMLKVWKPIITKFSSSQTDQKLMVEGLARCAKRHAETLEVFAFMINLLYQWDILEEEAALDWEDEETERKDDGDKGSERVLERAKDFLEYLKTADEEEDEDEDE